MRRPRIVFVRLMSSWNSGLLRSFCASRRRLLTGSWLWCASPSWKKGRQSYLLFLSNWPSCTRVLVAHRMWYGQSRFLVVWTVVGPVFPRGFWGYPLRSHTTTAIYFLSFLRQ